MNVVFDAWIIETGDRPGGCIGRNWFLENGAIPAHVEGCRVAMFKTRKIAREHLPKVKRAFPKARVIRVKVRATG